MVFENSILIGWIVCVLIINRIIDVISYIF